MNEQYQKNKAAKVGDQLICTCGEPFVKTHWAKAFHTPACKDKFWNAENRGKYKSKSRLRKRCPEQYYEINPYWCSRRLLFDGEVMNKRWWGAFLIGTAKKSITSNKSISYRQEGVEIGVGNPEYGASGELVFIVKIEV
jgi:hypothetical protein